jgi:4-diphosphocytidyl-2-C-methyl-D-erythritol kinase
VLREPARAKLNLFLDVAGRRADGYHDLVTVFHEIDLADEVTAEIRGGGGPGEVALELAGEPSADVPADATNLAVRAARALLDASGSGAALRLRLTKRIPSGAGLGGGSADAAAALRAVDRLLGLGTPRERMLSIAATLGSDVPFLVEGGSALGRGRGEVLERVPARPMRFLLLVPSFAIATAAVYRALPAALPPSRDPSAVLRALAAGDDAALAASATNALLGAACAVEPRLAEVLGAARAALGPRVHLTGSGSTLFVPLRPGESPPERLGVPHLARSLVARSRESG